MPCNSAIVTHTTRQEVHNTHITQALMAVFDTAYSQSFVGVATRKKSDPQVCMQCWVRVCNLASYFNHFVPQKYDTYITGNTFKGGFCDDVAHHRRANHLASINNLIIDLDFHKDYMSPSNLLLLLREYVKDVDAAVANGDIPPYRMWVYTGRGLQFWYSIKPLAPILKFFADAAIQGLIAAHNTIRTQRKNIFKYGLYDDLTIDTIASQRTSGLFRLPFSYNTSARVFGKCYINQQYTSPHINDLLDALGIVKQVWKKPSKKAYKGVSGTRQPKYLPLLMRRRDLLEFILPHIDRGRREICCWLYYNNAVQIYNDTDMAKRALERYNEHMNDPIHANQLRSLIKAVDRVGFYKIKASKFAEIAQITEDEVMIFMEKRIPPSVARRNAEREQKRAKKERRNDKIRELALEGLSQREIAKELNVGQTTVMRVTKPNKAIADSRTIKKEHQLRQIAAMLEAHKSYQDMADALQVSRATVARRVAELKKR